MEIVECEWWTYSVPSNFRLLEFNGWQMKILVAENLMRDKIERPLIQSQYDTAVEEKGYATDNRSINVLPSSRVFDCIFEVD